MPLSSLGFTTSCTMSHAELQQTAASQAWGAGLEDSRSWLGLPHPISECLGMGPSSVPNTSSCHCASRRQQLHHPHMGPSLLGLFSHNPCSHLQNESTDDWFSPSSLHPIKIGLKNKWRLQCHWRLQCQSQPWQWVALPLPKPCPQATPLQLCPGLSECTPGAMGCTGKGVLVSQDQGEPQHPEQTQSCGAASGWLRHTPQGCVHFSEHGPCPSSAGKVKRASLPTKNQQEAKQG